MCTGECGLSSKVLSAVRLGRYHINASEEINCCCGFLHCRYDNHLFSVSSRICRNFLAYLLSKHLPNVCTALN